MEELAALKVVLRPVSVNVCEKKSAGGGRHLGPLAGLEAAVGVDPEELAVAAQQVNVQEGLDLALNELHTARTSTPGPVSQVIMGPSTLLTESLTDPQWGRTVDSRHALVSTATVHWIGEWRCGRKPGLANGGKSKRIGSARGHDGGVNIVDAGSDVAAVAVLGQSAQHLIAGARVLDRQHVSIQAVNGLCSKTTISFMTLA